MSGAIHGGLLVVIASFAFLLVARATRNERGPAAGLRGPLLMMCIQTGMLGAAMVLYAWAQHGLTALAVGVALSASGIAGACAMRQRRPAQRDRLSPRTQPSA